MADPLPGLRVAMAFRGLDGRKLSLAAGIVENDISKIKTAKRSPTVDERTRIAKALAMPAEFVFGTPEEVAKIMAALPGSAQEAAAIALIRQTHSESDIRRRERRAQAAGR